jgi:hypothetical protein
MDPKMLTDEELAFGRAVIRLLEIQIDRGLSLPEGMLQALDRYKSARDAMDAYEAEKWKRSNN